MNLHERAWCLVCSWAYDGPDADREGHLHSTSKARGHIRHATVTASHGSDECGADCRRDWFANNHEGNH